MNKEVTLNDLMSSKKKESLAKFPAHIGEALLKDLEEMTAANLLKDAPKVGDKLVPFSLPNQNGDVRDLNTLLSHGPVVIIFYRGGWCPYCNLELRAFQNNLPAIKDLGATLITITPEVPDASLTMTERHNLKFEILTDHNSSYAKELNLMFVLPEYLRPYYKRLGIDLEKHNRSEPFNFPFAATLVIDTNGTIAFSYANHDYAKRAEPSDVLNTLSRITKKYESHS